MKLQFSLFNLFARLSSKRTLLTLPSRYIVIRKERIYRNQLLHIGKVDIFVVLHDIIHLNIIDNLEKWLSNSQINGLISSIGVPSAILFSLYSVLRARKNEKYQNLLLVFQLFNNETRIKSRRLLYNLHNETDPSRIRKILFAMGFEDDSGEISYSLLQELKEIIKIDFNQVGFMIENQFLAKESFLKIYWHDVIKSWIALRNDILTQRNMLKDEYYMYGFELLNKHALRYIHKRNDLRSIHFKDIKIEPKVIDIISDRKEYTIIIEIVFDLSIDQKCMKEEYFSITNNEGDNIDFDLFWKSSEKSVFLQLSSNNIGKNLNLQIKKGIKDKFGDEMSNSIKKSIDLD